MLGVGAMQLVSSCCLVLSFLLELTAFPGVMPLGRQTLAFRVVLVAFFLFLFPVDRVPRNCCVLVWVNFLDDSVMFHDELSCYGVVESSVAEWYLPTWGEGVQMRVRHLFLLDSVVLES